MKSALKKSVVSTSISLILASGMAAFAAHAADDVKLKATKTNVAFSDFTPTEYSTKGKPNIIVLTGFAPIFPDICYHLTHYRPAAADIPVASDNPTHYADAIRYNARTPLQGSLLPLTRLVWV